MTVPFSEVTAEGRKLSISLYEQEQQGEVCLLTLFTVIAQISDHIDNSSVKWHTRVHVFLHI